jgi:hypothetical protein
MSARKFAAIGGMSSKLPAQNAGGRYKSNRLSGFVAASPSRAFRDGEGILLVTLHPYVRSIP